MSEDPATPPAADPPKGAGRARPCPVCGAPASRQARPFCSRRCADVDLHRWLGGQYAIPVVEEDGGASEETDER